MSKQLKKGDIVDFAFGKLPPQVPELEMAVLGAMLIDKSAHEFIPECHKELFYKGDHQLVFAAIEALYERRSDIDALTVVEELKKSGSLDKVGGMMGVVQLTNSVFSAAHIESHLAIIKQKYLQRRLIEIGSKMVTNAYEDTTDIFELLEDAEKILYTSKESAGVKTDYVTMAQIMTQMFKNPPKDEELPLSLGDSSIDKYETGTPGEVTVVAGRPGMGKTAYALWEARKTAEQGYPVAFFSYEMKNRVLASRMLSKSGVPFSAIKSGKIDPTSSDSYRREMGLLHDLPIYMVDDSTLDMRNLMNMARRFVKRMGVKRLYIDQLSLVQMKGNDYNKDFDRMTAVMRNAKLMAMDLNVPVTVLAQIGRSVETRGGLMKPTLSDLKQTGAIEEYADSVVLLWRPEYYYTNGNNEKFRMVQHVNGSDVSSKGYLERIHAKSRNLSPGVEVMTFDAPKYDFMEWRELPYTERDDNYRQQKEEMPWA